MCLRLVRSANHLVDVNEMVLACGLFSTIGLILVIIFHNGCRKYSRYLRQGCQVYYIKKLYDISYRKPIF